MYFLLYKQKYTQKLFLILFLASFHSFSASLAANILENILYILFFQFPLPSSSQPTTPAKLLSTWLSTTLMQLQPMLVSWLHFIWPNNRNRYSWSFFPPWYIVFQWISKTHPFLGCISTSIIILTLYLNVSSFILDFYILQCPVLGLNTTFLLNEYSFHSSSSFTAL